MKTGSRLRKSKLIFEKKLSDFCGFFVFCNSPHFKNTLTFMVPPFFMFCSYGKCPLERPGFVIKDITSLFCGLPMSFMWSQNITKTWHQKILELKSCWVSAVISNFTDHFKSKQNLSLLKKFGQCWIIGFLKSFCTVKIFVIYITALIITIRLTVIGLLTVTICL